MDFFRKYLLPGFIFQSVVIGGGYATGRELVEFFYGAGPVGGLLGLSVAGAVFALVLAIGFEFARVTGAHDYRLFCKALLGRGYVVFEIAFILLLLLILSVISSASGELAAASFGVPPLVGTVALMALVALLTFHGTETIKRVLAAWSFLLYLTYGLLFVFAFMTFGSDIQQTYAEASSGTGWVKAGILYSGYNVAVLPAVLFAVQRQSTRQEAVGSGLLAGAIAVLPAMLFYIAMMALYPQIGGAAVPAAALMAALKTPALELLFQIVVFGTFVETGTALLHALNERLETGFREAGAAMPRILRPAIAVGALVLAITAGSWFGIIDLIARGYGLLTLVFIAVLVVPLLTIGLWRVTRKEPQS